jgi:hypothetical protein
MLWRWLCKKKSSICVYCIFYKERDGRCRLRRPPSFYFAPKQETIKFIRQFIAFKGIINPFECVALPDIKPIGSSRPHDPLAILSVGKRPADSSQNRFHFILKHARIV